MHSHCFVCYDKTWMKTVLTCFTKMIAEHAAILDPIWTTNVPYERKINMLSFIDNNFMICLFDFERFSIESRFPFFLLTLYIYSTVCYFLIFIFFIMRPNVIFYGASYCEVCKNMVQISMVPLSLQNINYLLRIIRSYYIWTSAYLLYMPNDAPHNTLGYHVVWCHLASARGKIM